MLPGELKKDMADIILLVSRGLVTPVLDGLWMDEWMDGWMNSSFEIDYSQIQTHSFHSIAQQMKLNFRCRQRPFNLQLHLTKQTSEKRC